MKKKLTALLAGLFLSFAFAGCGLASTNSSQASSTENGSSTIVSSETASSSEGVESSSSEAQSGYTYTAFTAAEKALLNEYLGEEIPFIANNEYYVEEYTYTDKQTIETGIYFYTVGNTEEEFDAYKDLLDKTYRFYQMQVEENGYIWYSYQASQYSIRVAYCETEQGFGINLFAYTLADWEDWDSTPPQSSVDSSVEDSSIKDSSTDSSVEGIVGGIYTLSFDDLSNRITQTDYVQVWENGGVKLTNNKNESSQPINGTYYNPIRLYAGTNAVIECADMRKIEFVCNDYKADYVIELANALNALSGVTVSTKGQVVTVEFNTAKDSITITFAKQVRLNSLTVYTGNSGSTLVPPENSTDSSTNSSADDIVDGDFGEILLTLYGLSDGESLTGEFTLTGEIISLDDYDNPTIVVEGFEDMPVYCYRLRLPDASVGDVITVTATTMKNHEGTYEFMNCALIENQGGGNTSNHTYTEFTTDEKAAFQALIGEVIPFIANDKYYVEEYTLNHKDEGFTEIGLNFYTFGNTQAEFNAYKAILESRYEYSGSEADEYGDMWYYYDSAEYCIDVTYYYYEGEYVFDLYAYIYTEYTGGGNGGNTETDVDLITNEGKGLPTSANGIYDIDFTKATYVKNVTEQGYYEYGCPTLSTTEYNPAVLVIPVEFSDVTAASKNYTIDAIKAAFNGGEGETDYYSVHDYYYISSYGKLDLNITVLDTWFRPQYASSYYAEATIDYFGTEVFGGDQLIMNEALAYLSESMNLSAFDADGNTCIDAVIMINTLEIDDSTDFQWAYRYWNIYTDDEGYYYEYDGVSANDYLWASYQFLFETYDEDDNVIYDENVRNTYTYIHEFGHVLGADDYYDTSYSVDYEDMPLSGCDIMDSMLGDHNAYSKFNYGWLTSSRLVVAEESVTLTLEDFSKNGDTIIIANNWDEALGAYQEYYIVVYYTMNGLNGTVNGVDYGYFSCDGIIVYHVNASLYGEDYGDGTIYYDVYNNNTDGSDEYGTADNLIELVKSPADTFTYIEGDRLSTSLTDDQGNKIAYTFTVDSLTADSATLTFTKN